MDIYSNLITLLFISYLVITVIGYIVIWEDWEEIEYVHGYEKAWKMVVYLPLWPLLMFLNLIGVKTKGWF